MSLTTNELQKITDAVLDFSEWYRFAVIYAPFDAEVFESLDRETLERIKKLQINVLNTLLGKGNYSLEYAHADISERLLEALDKIYCNKGYEATVRIKYNNVYVYQFEKQSKTSATDGMIFITDSKGLLLEKKKIVMATTIRYFRAMSVKSLIPKQAEKFKDVILKYQEKKE